MTIMSIPIPDDLKADFERAFPSETIEQAIERLLRAEVDRKLAPQKAGGQSLMELARRIREASLPTTNDEIRAIRHEGRP